MILLHVEIQNEGQRKRRVTLNPNHISSFVEHVSEPNKTVIEMSNQSKYTVLATYESIKKALA